MIKLNKKLAVQVLTEAAAVNFYGKRKRDTRLETAENIVAALAIQSEIEPADLVIWLDANKPAQPEKKKRQKADNKPAANTIQHGFTDAPALPILFADSNAVIITAAQNNTALNVPAWEALKAFAADTQADLVVLPMFYNKNAFSAAKESESEHFDPAVVPYLVTEDHQLIGDQLVTVRPSAAVVPTAKLPVNAASTLNNGELVTIVGSTKQQLKTLVRSPSMPIRESWATGCVTQINYTRSRAGSEATADHVFGGVLVINCNGRLYVRNLVFSNGILLDASTIDQRTAVAVLGDLHSERKDPEIWQSTLEWLDYIAPCEIVVHDILHFETANHHNRNKGDHLYRTKDRQVIDDLRQVITDLNELASIAPIYVVESNHNSALDNWLHDVNYNPKRDPRQAKLYYLLNYLVCDAFDDSDKKGQVALQVAFDNLSKFEQFPELSDRVVFGSMDRSELRYGTDVSQHGHKGQNGSAGSTGLFSRWSFPMVTGHTHSPAIIGKVLTVGVTASLHQGYNAGGGSSWNQSHALILPNGTRQIYPMRGLYL